METVLTGIGKKFHNKWIFKDINFSLKAGHHHAIVGKNGSGKSTLLMILAGYVSPTKGNILWNINGNSLPSEKVYSNVSIASPYLELIEEFTFEEIIAFQQKFKPFQDNQNLEQIMEYSGLKGNQGKPIKNYSSGMKQRARLVLAIMSKSSLLLLDEPCSNLDADAVQWYQMMIDTFCKNRTLVVSSNHNKYEYHSSEEIVVDLGNR